MWARRPERWAPVGRGKPRAPKGSCRLPAGVRCAVSRTRTLGCPQSPPATPRPRPLGPGARGSEPRGGEWKSSDPPGWGAPRPPAHSRGPAPAADLTGPRAVSPAAPLPGGAAASKAEPPLLATPARPSSACWTSPPGPGRPEGCVLWGCWPGTLFPRGSQARAERGRSRFPAGFPAGAGVCAPTEEAPVGRAGPGPLGGRVVAGGGGWCWPVLAAAPREGASTLAGRQSVLSRVVNTLPMSLHQFCVEEATVGSSA